MCRPRDKEAAGVTLVETLIVIGVLGVLIALLLPAMRGARSAAGASVSLGNLSTLGQALEVYAGSNRGQFPYPPQTSQRTSSSGPLFGPVYSSPSPTPATAKVFFAPIFRMERYWPMVMHDAAPWDQHYGAWLSPGLDISPGRAPLWERVPEVSYRYSHSFVASSRVWRGEPGVTWDDVGPQLMSSVAHPSSKVVMYDGVRAYLGASPDRSAPRPVLFADSSASLRQDAKARAPGENSLTGRSRLYHDTANGILGVDF